MIKKAAVVTGAARGIGLATVKQLISEGWYVAMLDVDAVANLQAHQILSDASNVIASPCDISSPASVTAAAERVMSQWSRVDALVNNAGIAIFKPALETIFEEWSKVLDVHLSGAFICSQIFASIDAEVR